MKYAEQFYALVDHSGSFTVNPKILSRLEIHAANLIIKKPCEGNASYSVTKDRWDSARLLFNLSGHELTQQQADEIVVYHVSLALKYRRS